MGVIITRVVTLHAGGEDSGCVVGKPSLIGKVRVARQPGAIAITSYKRTFGPRQSPQSSAASAPP